MTLEHVVKAVKLLQASLKSTINIFVFSCQMNMYQVGHCGGNTEKYLTKLISNVSHRNWIVQMTLGLDDAFVDAFRKVQIGK